MLLGSLDVFLHLLICNTKFRSERLQQTASSNADNHQDGSEGLPINIGIH